MLLPIAEISSSTAIFWSAFGAFLAYLMIFLLPTLLKQRKKEEETEEKLRTPRRTIEIAFVVLICMLGAGVGAAKVIDPCSEGDAWMCGLGSLSFIGGLSGLIDIGVPRP